LDTPPDPATDPAAHPTTEPAAHPTRPGQPDGLVHDLHDGPDVPPEVAAGRRAADAARRVLAGLTASRADPDTLAEVAAALDRLADTLEPHQPASRWPSGPDPQAGVWESHPLIGPSHPLAPPIRVVRHGDRAVGTATFGHVYEGPPGAVHGGIVAAMFDIVLISAATVAQVMGLTGTLTVRYRAPTPLHREIRYEAWIEEVHARKALVAGRSTVDGVLLAEADGVFVRPARA
jgi:acyl-coenzyme A thioesterase PaaI-like protein